VVAVAGIARPQRFFTGLREQGFNVTREVVFRDHHWFTAGDIERVERIARAAGAAWIVTTEKDAVRLPAGIGASWLRLPMRVAIEPPDVFAAWLRDRLADARRQSPRASSRRTT
jgi:tetraacyldisaccharide 4'-kinase